MHSMPGIKIENKKVKQEAPKKITKEAEVEVKGILIRQFSTFKKKILNRGDSFHIKEESCEIEDFSSLSGMLQ